MKRSNVTYAQFNRMLSALGVSHRRVDDDPPTYLYEHAERGPITTLPAYPDRNRVYMIHVVAMRYLLDQFGIAEPSEFDANIQKAG